jgi:glycosyltransferase involved in cell wall biosynthesis
MDDNISTFVADRPIVRRFAAWYMRQVYAVQFDAHLAVSAYAAAELDGIDRPVHVAPMGLHVSRFAAAPKGEIARQRVFGRAGRSQCTVLLYVGRVSREKNVRLLVDTLAELTNEGERGIHLVVAGDGPLVGWLMDEAARRVPSRVHVLGHISDRERLATLYANADLFVHPNPREPFGIAPLEAMAAGLPLVAPAAGGILEYASEDNAWLTEPTAPAFAAAIRCALGSPDQRTLRAERARKAAGALDWAAVTARYFALYDEIHARSSPTRPVTEPSTRARSRFVGVARLRTRSTSDGERPEPRR